MSPVYTPYFILIWYNIIVDIHLSVILKKVRLTSKYLRKFFTFFNRIIRNHFNQDNQYHIFSLSGIQFHSSWSQNTMVISISVCPYLLYLIGLLAKIHMDLFLSIEWHHSTQNIESCYKVFDIFYLQIFFLFPDFLNDKICDSILRGFI